VVVLIATSLKIVLFTFNNYKIVLDGSSSLGKAEDVDPIANCNGMDGTTTCNMADRRSSPSVVKQ